MSGPTVDSDGALRFSFRDYRQWNDGQRWELIDGTARPMCRTCTVSHQSVVTALSAQLYARLESGPCRVLVAPLDVRLPKDDEDEDDAVTTVVQPDVLVVCDPTKLDEQGCRGAPDFIIEVLSRSTAARDQIIKRDLYERHGVREYWLVHPVDRIVTVYRLGPDGRYGRALVQETTGRLAAAAVERGEIDWDRVFG